MPRTDSSLTGILIQETDSLGLITLGQFTGIGSALPTTASKFAVGCLMSCAGDSKTYFNAGTVAVPSWNSVSDASVGEIALTTGSVLIGAAGVGSALDAKTSGQILVGNGTTAVSVAVSGDATLAANGALTIANDAVTDAKLADANVGQVRSATATADGLTTGALTAGSHHVTATSDDVNKIITLPPAVVGTRVVIGVGATGCELRTTSPTTISINGGSGAGAESELAAGTTAYLTCVATTAWTGFQAATDGTLSAVQVAAA